MLKNIVKIQHNSDFTLNCKLPSGYDNQDFIIRLYTTDKDNYYEASYLNGEYMNCLTDSENKNIVVYVNNHNLQPGCLHIGMQFDYDNTHFSDNVENIITAEETNVYLVKQNANATSAMYVGSALPDLTGSTDFVTQSDLEFELLNYYTKEDIDNASYISSSDLNDYVTEEELNDMGFLSQAQLDAMGYATISYVDTKTNQKQDRLINGVNIKTINGNSLLGNGDLVIEGGGSAIDMSAYVTHTFLQNQAYVTQSALNSMSYVTSSQLNNASYVSHAELNSASYVTEQALSTASYVTESEIAAMGYVTESQLQQAGYVTQSQLDQVGYATETYVADYVATHSGPIDLSSYVSKDELNQMGYVSQSDLSNASYVTEQALATASYVTESEIAAMGYVTESQLQQAGYVTSSDLSNMSYVTTSDLNTAISGINVPTKTSDLTNDSGFITSIPAEYVTESELSGIGYVTATELSNAGYMTGSQISQMGYITMSDVSAQGYITMSDVSACGYITSIPAEYVTETELSAMGYATEQLVNETASTMQGVLQIANVIWVDPDTGTVTVNEMATESYVSDYVAQHAPTPDLSAYVTKTELSAAGYLTAVPAEYVTESELSSMSYATTSQLPNMSDYVSKTELSQAGYLTSIPSEYVTETELSSMGYITSGDIPAIPVIDESIIPNTTLTYTLGDSSHLYNNVYTSTLNGPNTGLLLKTGGSNSMFLNSTTVRPTGNNTHSLGTSNYQWAYTYSSNFIENGTNISEKYATKVELPKIDENLIPNTTDTYTLGDSSHFYKTTYTDTVYFNTSDTRIWNNSTTGLDFVRNGTTVMRAIGGSTPALVPGGNNSVSLGSSTNQWSAAYITNVKFTGDGRSSISATNSTTLRFAPNDIGFYLDTNGFRPGSNGNKNLGTSSAQWAYTYSANFIENGTNISDIYTQTEVVTQAQYDALTNEEKNSETIYVISDQQAYFDNELVTEQSLSAKGYLTANNFQYDQSTGTLTLIL